MLHTSTSLAYVKYEQSDIHNFLQLTTDPQAKYSLSRKGTFGLDEAYSQKLGLDFMNFSFFKLQGKSFTQWEDELYHIQNPTSEGLLEAIIIKIKLGMPFSSDNKHIDFARQHLNILKQAYQGDKFALPSSIIQKIIHPHNWSFVQNTTNPQDGSGVPDKSIELDYNSNTQSYTVNIKNKITFNDTVVSAHIPFEYTIKAEFRLNDNAKTKPMEGFKLMEMTIKSDARYIQAFVGSLHTCVNLDLTTLLYPLMTFIVSNSNREISPQITIANKIKLLLSDSHLASDLNDDEILILKGPGKLHDIVWNLGFLIVIKNPTLYNKLQISTTPLVSNGRSVAKSPPPIHYTTIQNQAHGTTTTSNTAVYQQTFTTGQLPSNPVPVATMNSPVRAKTSNTLVDNISRSPSPSPQSPTFEDRSTQTDPRPKPPPYWSPFKKQLQQQPITTILAPDQSQSNQLPTNLPNSLIKCAEIDLQQLSSKIDDNTNNVNRSGTNINSALVQDFLSGLKFQNQIVNTNTPFNLSNSTVLNNPYIHHQVLQELQNIIKADVIPLITDTSCISTSTSSNLRGNAWSDIIQQQDRNEKEQQLTASHLEILRRAYNTRAIAIIVTILTASISPKTPALIRSRLSSQFGSPIAS